MRKEVYSGSDIGLYKLGVFEEFANKLIKKPHVSRIISEYKLMSRNCFDVLFFAQEGVVLRYWNDMGEPESKVRVSLFGLTGDEIGEVERIVLDEAAKISKDTVKLK